jgi:hypothetical protein
MPDSNPDPILMPKPDPDPKINEFRTTTLLAGTGIDRADFLLFYLRFTL